MVMNKTKRKDITGFLISFLILVLLNFIGSYVFFRLDLTSEKRYSISAPTKELLENLEDDIYVKVYLQGNDLPSSMLRLRNESREMLNEFRAYAGGKLDFEFINPSANPQEKQRERIYKNLYDKGLRPTDIEIRDGGSISKKLIWPGALISYQGKEMPVQLLKSQFGAPPHQVLSQSIESLEYELASTIKTISSKDLKRIAFIEGHAELNQFETADIVGSLRDFYEVSRLPINGNISALSRRFPANKDSSEFHIVNKFDAIVIADPDSAFSEKDKFIIDQYVMYGGKIVWLIDQVSADMDSLKTKRVSMGIAKALNLDDQFFKYGVRLNYDLIQDLRAAPIPVVSGQFGNQAQTQLYPWLFYPLLSSNNNHPINKNVDVVWARFANSIDLVGNDDLKKTILLSSSNRTKLVKAPSRISLSMVSFNPPEEQFNKSDIPIGVLVEGEFSSVFENRLPPNILDAGEIKFKAKSPKTQMVFFSDGDLIKNSYNPNTNEYYALGFDRYTKQRYGNKNLFMNTMNYLLDDSGLILSNNKSFKIRLLDTQLMDNNRLMIQLTNTALPILITILFGFTLNFIRKRKYTVKK